VVGSDDTDSPSMLPSRDRNASPEIGCCK
jgi:hypothetical protein